MMKRSLINRVISVAFILLLGCLPTRGIQAAEQTVDVQEIVFSHIQDAYTWHITEWNEKEISIPLPIIVKGEQGWDCFLSSRLHGGQTYHNYYIASEGEYAGKVVTKNQAGEEVRPLDFSLTKNVCGLFLGCAVLLTIILSTAKWYQRHPNQVPKGHRSKRLQAFFFLFADCILLYPDQQFDRCHPDFSGRRECDR